MYCSRLRFWPVQRAVIILSAVRQEPPAELAEGRSLRGWQDDSGHRAGQVLCISRRTIKKQMINFDSMLLFYCCLIFDVNFATEEGAFGNLKKLHYLPEAHGWRSTEAEVRAIERMNVKFHLLTYFLTINLLLLVNDVECKIDHLCLTH